MQNVPLILYLTMTEHFSTNIGKMQVMFTLTTSVKRVLKVLTCTTR